jgi:hypothetical protein
MEGLVWVPARVAQLLVFEQVFEVVFEQVFEQPIVRESCMILVSGERR